MNTNPGAMCPYCKKMIKFERKGKQKCPKCAGPLEVDIKETLMEGQSTETVRGIRTYLRVPFKNPEKVREFWG